MAGGCRDLLSLQPPKISPTCRSLCLLSLPPNNLEWSFSSDSYCPPYSETSFKFPLGISQGSKLISPKVANQVHCILYSILYIVFYTMYVYMYKYIYIYTIHTLYILKIHTHIYTYTHTYINKKYTHK